MVELIIKTKPNITEKKEIRFIGCDLTKDKTTNILFDNLTKQVQIIISLDSEEIEELYTSITKFRDHIKNPEKYDDTNFDDDEKLLQRLGE